MTTDKMDFFKNDQNFLKLFQKIEKYETKLLKSKTSQEVSTIITRDNYFGIVKKLKSQKQKPL